MTSMRDFSRTKRIVIKVGTNVLAKGGQVDTDFLGVIARQIADLVRQKRQVILVTSGAIGMGAGALGIRHKISEVKKRQALASVGQGILMHEYQQAFQAHGQKVAQVLLTYANFTNRKYYVNLKNAVETLLGMGVVPIVNENDCVSIDEIDLAFGDNDKLSALVASKIDAELLILLTDVEGLYDKNPRTGRKAQLIPVVHEITEAIEAMAGKAGSAFATGGMVSKLEAARTAANGGCKVILANGRNKDVILRIVQGEEIGTLFMPKRRLSNRQRWILLSKPVGRIEVDPGAATAVLNRKSLLAVGISSVKGNFKKGDVVEIRPFAKGIVEYSATQLRRLLVQGRTKSTKPKRKAVIHADNLVLLE
jgi:glutamate 5-kinase